MPEDIKIQQCSNCRFFFSDWCYQEANEKPGWMFCGKHQQGAFNPDSIKDAQTEHDNKASAVMQAIRDCPVGSEVIVHNDDGTVFVILKVVAKEMEHRRLSC